MSTHALGGGWMGEWRPGVGDPTFLGWFTVAAYFAATGCCWRARVAANRVQDPAVARGSVRVWSMLVIGLLALGVNKQLDLQSAVTALGRSMVRAQGWEARREELQRGFVVGVAALAATVCVWLAVLARRELGRMALALLGWTGLCLFVGIRAASFHHVDRMLGLAWAGASLNAVVELSGIAIVALGAVTHGRALLREPSARRQRCGLRVTRRKHVLRTIRFPSDPAEVRVSPEAPSVARTAAVGYV